MLFNPDKEYNQEFISRMDVPPFSFSSSSDQDDS